MIVRLMGQGQYEINKKQVDELNIIDNNIVKIVENGDENEFKTEFKKLIDYVLDNGKQLPDNIIKTSEIIVPPEDLSFKEAKELFNGDGIIEG